MTVFLTIIAALLLLNIGTILGVMYAAPRGSISFYNKQRDAKKKTRKAMVLQLAQEKPSIKNKDVERLLSVSSKTATNYLQELKDEGRLKQHGNRGRSVYYTFT